MACLGSVVRKGDVHPARLGAPPGPQSKAAKHE
jgi:hypothetical protein